MSAVLIPTASETEWLQARRRGITASEIAVVMGLSPYSSPYKLYHQKLGILPADDDNAAMERGRVLEPYIAEKFAAAHPDYEVIGDGRSLYAHPDRPWQLATPDRLLDGCDCDPAIRDQAHRCPLDPLAVLETKTDAGSDEWGEPGTDEIPVHYRCQVLWQMDVMGVGRAYVACLRIRDWKLLEYEIGHAEGCGAGRNMLAYPSLACQTCDDLALMLDGAREFLDRVRDQDPPDVDWHPATTAALKALHPAVEDIDVTVGRQLAISYRAAVRHFEQAERRKKEMTNRLLEAIGDGRRAIEAHTGLPVATRSVSHPKRVSSTLLRERYPAIAAECTPEPKPEIKLLPAKPKKEVKTS